MDRTAASSQCTDSSFTNFEISTASYSLIGQWNPPAGLGIKVGRYLGSGLSDSVTPTAEAALGVGTTSQPVVVRDQTFASLANTGNRYGAKIETSSSATFCKSTFVARNDETGVLITEGRLNIVDSTLEGKSGLIVSNTNSHAVVTGTNTKVIDTRANYTAIGVISGRLDVYEGTIGDGSESFSLVLQTGGTANIYGGDWKSDIIMDLGPTLNVYFTDSARTTLCDGNSFTASITRITGTVNYLDCPPDYQVPSFSSECD